jgi:hypothetical protein
MAEMKDKRRFAEHQGGTKAYQIFEVQCGANCAVVTQYGKFSPGSDPVSMGGTIGVEGVYGVAQARGFADRKQAEKKRRGYNDWDEDVFSAGGEASFKDILRKMFGVRKADSIFQLVSAGPVRAPSDPIDPTPEVDPENDVKGKAKAPVIEIEQSSPEWGSW